MSCITIVCCYNNIDLYNGLLSNISQFNINVAIIGIDNTNGRYSSCASAYNSVLNTIFTPYVMFCHQDIRFDCNSSFARLIEQLNGIDHGDIIGVAGVRKQSSTVFTNIFQVDWSSRSPGNRVNGMIDVQTVDECFFGGMVSTFINHPFDAHVCPGWHLYAADQCLYANAVGKKVWVSDFSLLHLSPGRTSQSFIINYIKLAIKYRNDFSQIRTCCGYFKTDFFGFLFSIIKAELVLLKRNILGINKK